MTAATLVSTDDVAPRERAPVWRDWIWKHFGGLESDLYGDTDFDGHMATVARRRRDPDPAGSQPPPRDAHAPTWCAPARPAT